LFRLRMICTPGFIQPNLKNWKNDDWREHDNPYQEWYDCNRR
jgi:hypothetical protein